MSTEIQPKKRLQLGFQQLFKKLPKTSSTVLEILTPSIVSRTLALATVAFTLQNYSIETDGSFSRKRFSIFYV
jgi:hypothetical protein